VIPTTSEISRKVQNIMAREMGHLGKFIVQKQCKDIGMDPEEIDEKRVQELAKALGKVMLTFGGEEKARRIEQEIRRLGKTEPIP